VINPLDSAIHRLNNWGQSCKNDTLPSFTMLKLCYYKIRFWSSKFEESNNFIQQ